MGTGFRGTFVISWSQTEVDGQRAAPIGSLIPGAAWRWQGDAVRVDGPNNVLRLDEADAKKDIRRRATGMVSRLVGAALEHAPRVDEEPDAPLLDSYFVVTDGRCSYTVTLIETGAGLSPLLMFVDAIPPRERDLWLVHHTLDASAGTGVTRSSGGVICFTPGTRIRTQTGSRPIEELREGDRVQTKDNGMQEIRWIGSRVMTGARLMAMPELRPVRLRANALGDGMPDATLLVSPQHRIVLGGEAARDLFNSDEVLVTARDLVDGSAIAVESAVRQVTYVHLLLDRHEVLWANGVETESFHPASAALGALNATDRERLLAGFPDVASDPHCYGAFARRSLSGSEAAILRHVA